ncbi:hypothetical protein KKC60_05925 [Patescibacteria group bacterium]|nr:hypothetical protein [Patescibacteria group bacterium]
MKTGTQNKIKALIVSLILFLGMEMMISFPELITQIAVGVAVLIIPLTVIFLKVGIRSFARASCALTSLLFVGAAMLDLIFVEGFFFKQAYVIFVFACYFLLMGKFIGLKVLQIQHMAEDQQYSIVDFTLLATAFLYYVGFFGLFLYFQSFPLWLLLGLVFVTNFFLFFLFFYFNDIWLKKIWLYVFVLTFIVLEVTWALSYWPNGLLGRGIVLFCAYFLLSGLGKHYLKESFSPKVLRGYLMVGVIVLALVLSTGQWTY